MRTLSKEEIEKRLEQLDGWKYVDGALESTFQFKNFKDAFSIMTRIAFECEAQNHHPNWSNVYNSLNIRLYTHDANEVTERDFKLAKKIVEIMERE